MYAKRFRGNIVINALASITLISGLCIDKSASDFLISLWEIAENKVEFDVHLYLIYLSPVNKAAIPTYLKV